MKPVLSQYLERCVFICYWAAGSESVSVNCVTFGWQFCCKHECRLIFGKVCYGIINELLLKRLIQTTKHKCRFHDHFSKCLVTAIYVSGTRTAMRSVWQVNRHFLFLSTWAPCNLYTFQYHFQPTQIMWPSGHFDPKLPYKAAHSEPNPYFRLFPVAHSTDLSVPIPANFLRLCDRICKDILFWLPYAFFKHTNQYICNFCFIFLVGLKIRVFYILDFLYNVTNSFLYLWKIRAI